MPSPFAASICLLSALAFAALSAFAMWPTLRTGRAAADCASLVFAFLGVQTALVVASGLVGAFKCGALGCVCAIGSGALLAASASRARISACLRELVVPIARAMPGAARRHPLLALSWVAFAALLALRFRMFVLLLPPTSFDSLTYHLPKVAQWVQTGSLHLPDLPVKRVFWPGGSECLNAWWAVFHHSDLLANVPGHFFLAIIALAVYEIAGNVGVGRPGRAWCALSAVLVPALPVHATTCLNDLPVVAGFLYLAALMSRKSESENDARTRWTLCAAVACLTVGAKPTLAFLAPGILLLMAANARRTDFRVLLHPMGFSRGAAAIVAAAAFLGAFWYVRNWIRFGSPLYPVVLGENSEDGIQSGAFRLASVRLALGYLLDKGGLFDGKPVIANLWYMAGWGPFAVCCGIPASAAAAVVSRKYRVLLFAFLLSALSVLGSVVPDGSCLRFAIWFPAILCVGFFVFLETVRPPRAIAAAVAAIGLWTGFFAGASSLTNAAAIDWNFLRRHPRSSVSNLRPLVLKILRTIPEDATVAACLWREDPLYLLYGPRFTRRIVTLETLDGAASISEWLRANGADYLFFPRYRSWNHEVGAALARDLAEGRMEDRGMGVFARKGSK